MAAPAGYDWLATHNEAGETFAEYLDAGPRKPTKERQKIYLVPLGEFGEKQQNLINITVGYLEAFYDLPVELMPTRDLHSASPNFRQNKHTKNRQVKTTYILDKILRPMLPADAAALIALTTSDLYSNESTNFVFGQASLDRRVGIWSLARLDAGADGHTFLLRTLKIAAHETGHMFSMRHCTKWECVMSGTNHLAETDRRPIDACPECTAKICWLSDVDGAQRYERLAKFCLSVGLKAEAADFARKVDAVR